MEKHAWVIDTNSCFVSYSAGGSACQVVSCAEGLLVFHRPHRRRCFSEQGAAVPHPVTVTCAGRELLPRATMTRRRLRK